MASWPISRLADQRPHAEANAPVGDRALDTIAPFRSEIVIRNDGRARSEPGVVLVHLCRQKIRARLFFSFCRISPLRNDEQ